MRTVLEWESALLAVSPFLGLCCTGGHEEHCTSQNQIPLEHSTAQQRINTRHRTVRHSTGQHRQLRVKGQSMTVTNSQHISTNSIKESHTQQAIAQRKHTAQHKSRLAGNQTSSQNINTQQILERSSWQLLNRAESDKESNSTQRHTRQSQRYCVEALTSK